MLASEFDYHLPEELIAQSPPPSREDARMLVLDRADDTVTPDFFRNISAHVAPGDCVVLNDTKVMRARFYGKKESGATIETLLAERIPGPAERWSCLLRPAKRLAEGAVVALTPGKTGFNGTASFRLLKKNADGSCVVEFDGDMETIQENFGHVPLPPYIKRGDSIEDSSRYQTVFAQNPGAVAAPTAGLHFTEEILSSLRAKGVAVARTTLHVGPGTFKPVSVERIEDHKMHSENFVIPVETADIVNDRRKKGGKILAVGTTVARAMESSSDADGTLRAGAGSTDIFIHPPMRPKSFDMLLTNFHLPRSTLLMLVCAFAGKEPVMRAYETAVREKMRFYSYGDCMLVK